MSLRVGWCVRLEVECGLLELGWTVSVVCASSVCAYVCVRMCV